MKMKNTTRRLTRLFLKVIWFGTVLLIATVAWFALYAGIAKLTGVTQHGIPATIAKTTLAFLMLIGTYWLFFRKGKITLLRWTAKALLILSPFVILCSFALSTLNTILPSSHTPTDTPTQQEAIDTSNSSNNAPTSPQNGSQTSSGCFDQQIPYKTTYQNSSIYRKGEQHVAFAGTNGKQQVCITNGVTTTTTIMQPSDEIIYIGTREDSTGSSSNNVTVPPAQQYQPPSTNYGNPDNCHVYEYFCE